MSAVSQRRLEAVPAEVCSLARLQRLDVSGNALAALPAAVSQLTSLRCLAARQNRLTALPPELGACGALQVHMHASACLCGRFGLVGLTAEGASACQEACLEAFTRLALPATMSLTQLRGAAMLGAPSDVWLPWPSAQELDARQNLLPELPASLGGLVQLRELLLDGNRRAPGRCCTVARQPRWLLSGQPPSCRRGEMICYDG